MKVSLNMSKKDIIKNAIGIGGIILLLFVLMIIFSPFFKNPGRNPEYYLKKNVESQLKQIGLGLILYANDNDDKFPEKLSTLYPGYVSEIKMFFYPDDKSEIVTPENIDLYSCFEYEKGLTPTSESGSLLVYEKSNNHWKAQGRNELLVDGSVRWNQMKD